MFAYLEGKVADKGLHELVIDVGGIGFQLSVSMNTLQEAPAAGETMKVYTYFSIRQDGVDLFGFAAREEKEMFLKLISVTGIGPRVALGILGSMPLRELSMAIMLGDIASLSRAPGVGKKTAQRLALELKEKVTQEELDSVPPEQAAVLPQQQDAAAEALAALQALGYTPAEAARAISQVRGQSDSANELVRLALRGMSIS